jgi:hypothetical protein
MRIEQHLALHYVARARKNAPNWESASKIYIFFELANKTIGLMLVLLLEYFQCA